MKHPIDLEHWNRKEHFLFFGSMDDPFFGLTTSLSASTESTWEQRLGGKTEHSASASSNIHRTGNCSFKTHRKRSNVCKLSQAFAKIGNQTGKT